MGLFASLYICSFRLPTGPGRSHMQAQAIRVLIPSLLPLAAAANTHIDYGAHLGGTLSGAIMGYVLLKSWTDASPLPPLRKLAEAVATAGLILSVLGFVAVANHYPVYKNLGLLIPEDQVPKTGDDKMAHAADLVARYPHDPRSHIYQANALLVAHDLAGAQHELETALTESRSFYFIFGPKLDIIIRGELATVLTSRNQQTEAIKVAQPICQTVRADPAYEKMLKMLNERHLCE
jgi:rhomboid protease GluP